MTPQKNLIQILSPYLEKWKEMTQPFVWRLLITYEVFEEALGVVESSLTSSLRFREFLDKPEYADALLIMTGEWYKRCYTGEGNLPEWIKTIDFKNLWEKTSLRFPQKWVYKYDDGNNSWQYSAFVLGGLACSWSWKKEALLKTLLEFFNGEKEDEINTANFDDGALALRRSIEKRGSIYHFFKEIIHTESKVRKFYDADTQQEVQEFSSRIDGEVKNTTANKMTLEWRYLVSQTYINEIYKTLQLHLHPENYNDKPTYYVSLEKMKDWGFTSINEIAEVEVFIRFYNGGRKTGVEIKVARLITTGKTSAGFIIEDLSSSPIPPIPNLFDSWEIIGKTGSQSKILFKKDEILPFDAVYQTASDPGAWSTRWRRGRAAVIFNDNCSIIDPQNHPVRGKQLIVNENSGSPVYWADIPVYVEVLYTDSQGNEYTKKITNPLAMAEVVITQKPFTSLFEYLDTNKVKVIEKDPRTGEETVSYLPLLYGTDGVALKVSTDKKNPVLLENTKDDKVLKFEYRQEDSPVEESELKEGITDIKVRGADQSAEIKVWYIPKKENYDAPVVRDLQKEEIIWIDEKSENIKAEDTDILDIYERQGGKNESAVFPVYRPWKRIYIFMNGNKVAVHKGDHTLNLGLLNLTDITLGVFDEDGYRLWDGKQHLEEFKSLTQSLASAAKPAKGLKNVVIRNYNAAAPPENESKTIGNREMQTDSGSILWAPPKYYKNNNEADFDPFADDESNEVINPKLTIGEAIENNLHIFIFNELFNRPELIKNTLKELHDDLGEEYFYNHRKTIDRILWENNISDFEY